MNIPIRNRGKAMKTGKLILACVLFGFVASLAYMGQERESPGAKMVAAADKFVSRLTAEQKDKCLFSFDSKERTRWFFIPLQDAKKRPTRKGLPLVEMTPEQKKLALDLVAAGTSDVGNTAATTIMSLEAILRAQEKGGAMVRNPEWYFFSVFGNPSKTGKWGWRVEGHHLSLNFTMNGTQVAASTPTFFGANPAEVKSGARKGLRILKSAEELAIQLFDMLEPEQKKIALQSKPFPEIQQATVTAGVGEPRGVSASKMTQDQKNVLLKLLRAYTERMPPEVAEMELKAARSGGIDNIHFAYTGGTRSGEAHTYRVQGPTFVIEFLNVQADSAGNPANHIHSVWRRIRGDFAIN
jgi:hypothetical protein